MNNKKHLVVDTRDCDICHNILTIPASIPCFLIISTKTILMSPILLHTYYINSISHEFNFATSSISGIYYYKYNGNTEMEMLREIRVE